MQANPSPRQQDQTKNRNRLAEELILEEPTGQYLSRVLNYIYNAEDLQDIATEQAEKTKIRSARQQLQEQGSEANITEIVKLTGLHRNTVSKYMQHIKTEEERIANLSIKLFDYIQKDSILGRSDKVAILLFIELQKLTRGEDHKAGILVPTRLRELVLSCPSAEQAIAKFEESLI